jgi:hypothetical protein
MSVGAQIDVVQLNEIRARRRPARVAAGDVCSLGQGADPAFGARSGGGTGAAVPAR